MSFFDLQHLALSWLHGYGEYSKKCSQIDLLKDDADSTIEVAPQRVVVP